LVVVATPLVYPTNIRDDFTFFTSLGSRKDNEAASKKTRGQLPPSSKNGRRRSRGVGRSLGGGVHLTMST